MRRKQKKKLWGFQTESKHQAQKKEEIDNKYANMCFTTIQQDHVSCQKKKKKITALFCTQVILCMTNKLRECEGETECANGRMLWKTPSRFENDKCNDNINVNETRRGKVKRRIKW